MSLGQLLTAGRSLVGVKSVSGKYQMSDPRSMPKFGSGRNPFQKKAAEAETATKAAELVPAPASPASAPIPTPVPANSSTTPRPRARPASQWKPKLGSWLAKVRGFSIGRGEPARPAKRPAQAELSLDHVTVVRNDLSDTDLEIRPQRGEASITTRARVMAPPPAEAPAKGEAVATSGIES